MNHLNRTVLTALGIGLFSVLSLQAARPQSKWHRAGKSAHAKAPHSSKARNTYCTQACKKAGARKATDLGACKEGCVFG